MFEDHPKNCFIKVNVKGIRVSDEEEDIKEYKLTS